MGVGKGGNGIAENEELVSKFWVKLFHNAFIVVKLSKYFKVLEHARVQVLGSIKDKCTFNSLFFLKRSFIVNYPPTSTLLSTYLHEYFHMGMAAPYQVAIFDWKSHKM